MNSGRHFSTSGSRFDLATERLRREQADHRCGQLTVGLPVASDPTKILHGTVLPDRGHRVPVGMSKFRVIAGKGSDSLS
jgi:hypothetical protein